MNSIRRQLTRRLLRTILGLLGVGIAALVAAAGYAELHQFDLALRTKALAISTVTSVAADGAVKVPFTDRFLRDFDHRSPKDFFEMRRADGTTVARSESLGEGHLAARGGEAEKPRYWLLTLPTGEPGRAVGFTFRPKATAGAEVPALTLVVASDRDELEDALELLFALGVVLAGLLAGATLGIVPRVLARGLAPLEALGDRAARIDAGSLATRFPEADLPVELRPIAGRLNALLARLEQSFERERRFSADLAHELRTPLAELQSLAENALKWPEARDPATDRETLAIARQMETLVSRMLALARGEQGQLASRPEPIALAPFVAAAWAPFAARAEARGLRAELTLAPATAAADPVLLRSILRNLFDNAVDYAPEGGVIGITLAVTGTTVAVTVANPAEALGPADAARLFDRFWRKEAARSGGQHVGLGLPLARTFATAMGWSLGATFADGRLAVTLTGDTGGAAG